MTGKALEPERLAELRALAFEGDGCTSNAMHEMLDEIERLRYLTREGIRLFERAARDDHRHPPDDHVSPETWEAIAKWQTRASEGQFMGGVTNEDSSDA